MSNRSACWKNASWHKVTYSSSCKLKEAGAVFLYYWSCASSSTSSSTPVTSPSSSTTCSNVISPVCSINSSWYKRTYNNKCLSDKDWARYLSWGKCVFTSSNSSNSNNVSSTTVCSNVVKTVCSINSSWYKRIYNNRCLSDKDDAKYLNTGRCDFQDNNNNSSYDNYYYDNDYNNNYNNNDYYYNSGYYSDYSSTLKVCGRNKYNNLITYRNLDQLKDQDAHFLYSWKCEKDTYYERNTYNYNDIGYYNDWESNDNNRELEIEVVNTEYRSIFDRLYDEHKRY